MGGFGTEPHMVLPKPGIPVITAIPPSKKTVGAPSTAQALPPVLKVMMSFCVPASLPCTAATWELVLIDFLPSIFTSSQPGSRLLVDPMIGYGIGSGLGAAGVMQTLGAIGTTWWLEFSQHTSMEIAVTPMSLPSV